MFATVGRVRFSVLVQRTENGDRRELPEVGTAGKGGGSFGLRLSSAPFYIGIGLGSEHIFDPSFSSARST